MKKTFRWRDSPPFHFMADGKLQGIDVDIAVEAMRRMDCNLKFAEMPWARALVSLQDGTIDFVSGAFDRPERREYAHFSSVPFYSPNVLFVRSDDTFITRLSKIEELEKTNFQLGAMIDVEYGPGYSILRDSAEFQDNLHYNSSYEALWRMLELGRIDGMIADEITGLMELKELGLQQAITKTNIVVSQAPAYFMFSKKTTSQAFVARYDQALNAMINEGVIDEIKARYLE